MSPRGWEPCLLLSQWEAGAEQPVLHIIRHSSPATSGKISTTAASTVQVRELGLVEDKYGVQGCTRDN